MNYSKPEVNTLGQAKSVIEALHQKNGSSFDGPGVPMINNPAYDLDE